MEIKVNSKKAGWKLTMKIWVGLVGLLFSFTVSAQSYLNFEKQSNEQQPILIELYSSQGCSSCPPAEQWISTFMDNDKLWKTYFPLSFHVSYWNYLGWKDPFSDRRYSKRQYDHLNLLNIRQVYTPQFVVNSHEWRGWFERDYDSLEKVKVSQTGQLKLSIKKGKIDAVYSGDEPLDNSDKFHLALVGSGFETQVTRGENRNKKLKQDFTVLDFQTFTANDEGHFLGSVRPKPELAKQAKKLAWVGWIERNGKALQAVGGWLASHTTGL